MKNFLGPPLAPPPPFEYYSIDMYIYMSLMSCMHVCISQAMYNCLFFIFFFKNK
ncbi:hypothetical protein HanRHA438_Chr17g0840991 [Helianthus annuus]|nr:hypothetical protein HanRHA438_Chr17g0840991 [Helianthus annuus]